MSYKLLNGRSRPIPDLRFADVIQKRLAGLISKHYPVDAPIRFFLRSLVQDEFVLFGFLMIFAAFFVFIFWRAWKVYNRKGFAMYLGMWACIVLCVVFAVHSTLPSSAPRRQIVGVISFITDHKEGRSHSYTVHFKTDDGLDFVLDGAAMPLFFAQGRDKVAVTYLDEHRAGHYPRAIEFRALTGPRAGYDTAVSADWFGPWLGLLFSALTGVAAIIGYNNNKRASQHGSHHVDSISL